MNTKEIKEYKKRLHLTRELREILVGILLGDAHLETQNNGRTYRLKIEQALTHKEYVDHLYEKFRLWVLTPPKIRDVITKGVLSMNYRFTTLNHGSFRFYGQQFYKNGKKCVPKIINRLITARGLAYWFMDDGSIKSNESKGIIFNTHCYSKKDVMLLINVLKDKFNLKAKVRRQKDRYQIYISGDSYEKFSALVKSYLLKEMEYKLPQDRRT